MIDLVERLGKEVAADPNDAGARSNLGTALFQAGRHEEAVALAARGTDPA